LTSGVTGDLPKAQAQSTSTSIVSQNFVDGSIGALEQVPNMKGFEEYLLKLGNSNYGEAEVTN